MVDILLDQPELQLWNVDFLILVVVGIKRQEVPVFILLVLVHFSPAEAIWPPLQEEAVVEDTTGEAWEDILVLGVGPAIQSRPR
jgi:hypothetical protein